jgi:hypothetical protein
MRSITLGDVTVTRITEWEGCAPITAQLAPEGGREVWERHGSWLAPRFWDHESNEVVTCSASYLVRSAGKIILIDTASGNGKERPYFPLSSHLDTPYIQDLGRAGASRHRYGASSVTKKWATTGSHSSSSDVLLCTDLSKSSAEEPLVSLIRNQEDQ